MPLLVQLFLWFFVLPELLPRAVGLWLKQLPNAPFWTAAIGVGRFMSARVAVQLAAGVGSLPRGQKQAATALGLTTVQTYRYVLLPMAYRIVLPPLTSEFLSTIKNTAVAITIGLMELTGQARAMQEFSFQVFEAFTAATLLYLLINFIVVTAMGLLERKVAVPGYITGKWRDVFHSRLRRHPPLAPLPALRGHDVHPDPDCTLCVRRARIRHADRTDAALRPQAAGAGCRPLCRLHALAAAGAGYLLVLFPGALYRSMVDRRLAADQGRRILVLTRHLQPF